MILSKDDELNVKPGTPLNMEIYLDNVSKDIYGLLGKLYNVKFWLKIGLYFRNKMKLYCISK